MNFLKKPYLGPLSLAFFALAFALSCQEDPLSPSLRGELPEIGDPVGFTVLDVRILPDMGAGWVQMEILATKEFEVTDSHTDNGQGCDVLEPPPEDTGIYSKTVKCSGLEPERTYKVNLRLRSDQGDTLTVNPPPSFTTPSATAPPEGDPGLILNPSILTYDGPMQIEWDTEAHSSTEIYYTDTSGRERVVYGLRGTHHEATICRGLGAEMPVSLMLVSRPFLGEAARLDTTVSTLPEIETEVNLDSVVVGLNTAAVYASSNNLVVHKFRLGINEENLNRIGYEGFFGCGTTEAVEHFFFLDEGRQYVVVDTALDRQTLNQEAGSEFVTFRTLGEPLEDITIDNVLFYEIRFDGARDSVFLSRDAYIKQWCSNDNKHFTYCARVPFGARSVHDINIGRQRAETEVFVLTEAIEPNLGLGFVVAALRTDAVTTSPLPDFELTMTPIVSDESEDTAIATVGTSIPSTVSVRARVLDGSRTVTGYSYRCDTLHRVPLRYMMRDTTYRAAANFRECNTYPNPQRRLVSDTFNIVTEAGISFEFLQLTADSDSIGPDSAIVNPVETSRPSTGVRGSCRPTDGYSSAFSYVTGFTHRLLFRDLRPGTQTTCVIKAHETGLNYYRPVLVDSITFTTPSS